MDRLASEVKRELARFDGLPPARLQQIVELWPEAVGDVIAANAWPARLARDGTLHVATSSSTWAFELAQLASQILEKLGGAAPPQLRFAPGPLPEPDQRATGEATDAAVRPSADDERAAASLVAGIDDDDLRKYVAKAAALSLARARYDRGF